jgi:hypothetical protein
MSDGWTPGGNVRPMRPTDYSRGRPVDPGQPGAPGRSPGAGPPPGPSPGPQAGPPPADAQAPQTGPDDAWGQGRSGALSPARLADLARGLHPLRDLALGAVVGAAALWAVPKLLDGAWSRVAGREEDYGWDDFEDAEDDFG